MIPKVSFCTLTKNKNNQFPIYLRFYNGTPPYKYISTRIIVNSKDDFNNIKGRIKGRTNSTINSNKSLELILEKAKKHIQDLYNENETVNFLDFKSRMKGNSSNPPFVEMAYKTLEDYALTKSPSTIKKYKSIIRKFGEFDAKIPIDKINKNTINAFAKYLIAGNMQKMKPNNENSIRQYVSNLKYIYEDIIKRYSFDDKEPFKGIKDKLPKRPPKQAQPYSLKQLINLIEYIEGLEEGNEKEVCKFIIFSIATGMRKIDIFNVRYSDIKETSNGNFYLVKENIKTKKDVPTPIFSFAHKFFDLKSMKGKDELVFKINQSNINKDIKVLSEKLGFGKKSSHSGRRTTASMGRMLGIQLDDLKEFLGHSSKDMTRHYAGLDVESFIDNMSNQFNLTDSPTHPKMTGKNVQYSADAHRFMYRIGQKLKSIREKKKLTKAYVAQQLGTKGMNYSNIEDGNGIMSIPFLYDVCRIIGVDVGEVIRNRSDM